MTREPVPPSSRASAAAGSRTPPSPAEPLESCAEDDALMLALAGGDLRALDALVRRHQERVFRLAWHFLRDPEAAEDLAQDTFLRLCDAAPRYRPQGQFVAYLRRIAVNLCRDRLSQRRFRPQALPAAVVDASSPAPDAALRADELAQQVRAAVDALPERQRTVVILHRYEGLAHEQIAQTTGWTRTAVESLLVRAYASLRQRLAAIL